MTISELANISEVAERTIRKNITDIKGVNTLEPEITFIPGTRYKYNVRGTKLSTTEKRRLTLLMATSSMRYIDENMLHMSNESFNMMLEESLAFGLIKENGTNNPYGANKYDTTLKYTQFIQANKGKKYEEISRCLAIFMATFMNSLNR